eukprot:2729412-Pleurochrysis_carterae.AAC.4
MLFHRSRAKAKAVHGRRQSESVDVDVKRLKFGVGGLRLERSGQVRSSTLIVSSTADLNTHRV